MMSMNNGVPWYMEIEWFHRNEKGPPWGGPISQLGYVLLLGRIAEGFEGEGVMDGHLA